MKSRPNILVICSDQHTPYVTGCYGNGIIDTPNLDRPAREGTLYTNAYCRSNGWKIHRMNDLIATA